VNFANQSTRIARADSFIANALRNRGGPYGECGFANTAILLDYSVTSYRMAWDISMELAGILRRDWQVALLERLYIYIFAYYALNIEYKLRCRFDYTGL
jgi:hypothetical protein